MRFTKISNQIINVKVNNIFITWYVIISLSVRHTQRRVFASPECSTPLDTQRRVVPSLTYSALLRSIYKGESPLRYHAPLLCTMFYAHTTSSSTFFALALLKFMSHWLCTVVSSLYRTFIIPTMF